MDGLKKLYEPPIYKGRSIKFMYDTEIDLSFIIPVYNASLFLSKCIDSILYQKETDIYHYEIILIDDGSSDNSYQICKDYKRSYPGAITLVRKDNGGQASARNTGLEYAKGEYVAFVDDDDHVDQYYVKKTLDAAKENDADVVKCGRYEVKNGNKTAFSYPNGLVDREKIPALSGFVWEGIIRRDIFVDVSFPEQFWYEDMITKLLIYRIAKKIITIKDCLYYYNFHMRNTSRMIWGSDDIKCLDQLYLPKILIKYAREGLGIKCDISSDIILSKEWGELLYLRTRRLSISIRKKAFKKASHYAIKYIKNEDNISGFGRQNVKCLFEGRFYKWIVINVLHRYLRCIKVG